MLLLLPLFTLLSSFAQTDVDQYIQRFRYRALEVPAKRKALYDLGFKLFYDKNLSGKNNISCQDCHSLAGFSGDALPLGVGEGAEGLGERRKQGQGVILNRHTPSLYNAGLPDLKTFFWDGRVSVMRDSGWITPEPDLNGPQPVMASEAKTFASTLAVMTIFPLTSPEEMLGKESKLSKKEAWNLVLKKIFEGPFKATYTKMFKEAFPGTETFNIAHVGNALAELIRHHFSATNTLWDLYLRGRKDVLSERMKRGAVLFHTKANCIFCHNGSQFSNHSFQNINIPQIKADDQGRYNYQFKVPQLRNVGVTAPYMHSGVFKTLHEVVEHYNDPVASLRNFQWNPAISNYNVSIPLDRDSTHNTNREQNMSRALSRMLDLTPDEKDDLVCFLAVALTDVSLQNELIKKGVTNEISDCSPRPY